MAFWVGVQVDTPGPRINRSAHDFARVLSLRFRYRTLERRLKILLRGYGFNEACFPGNRFNDTHILFCRLEHIDPDRRRARLETSFDISVAECLDHAFEFAVHRRLPGENVGRLFGLDPVLARVAESRGAVSAVEVE